MSTSTELLKQLAREVALSPMEQAQAVGTKRKSLFIGIPKETTFQEHRVPLTPSSVAVLVGRGNDVVVERGAGRIRRPIVSPRNSPPRRTKRC